jgi:formate dehydrogenase iron-sulfur subunit
MAATLDIIRSSAGPTTPGIKSQPTIAKLVDTSTCIGCKACEVACQEWNDLPPEETTQAGTYQTMPDMTSNFWNLIRFSEHDTADRFNWLMRKDQCMHCTEPGCLIACPAPGAIVQYANGIVDFHQDNCIGCGYCMTGCPFNVPKLSEKTGRVYKCTMCVDRVSVGLQPACVKACPTSCLQFGTKDEMLAIANRRVDQLKANGYPQAAVYDPAGVGGTSVVSVLAFGDRPELYGLPADPTVPRLVTFWKGALKTIGNTVMVAGIFGAALHFIRYGRKHKEGVDESHPTTQSPRRGGPGGS